MTLKARTAHHDLGPVAIEPSRANGIISRLAQASLEHVHSQNPFNMDLASEDHPTMAALVFPEADDTGAEYKDYVLDGNNAIINMKGPILKEDTFFARVFGYASTKRIQAALAQALQDPAAKTITLHIDSPGGFISGVDELANDVKLATENKPVFAFVEDLGASAAYWVASQASAIIASSPTTEVGSIGIIAGPVFDWSKALEAEGLRAVVMATGKRKADFAFGLPITDDMVEHHTAKLNQLNAIFKGRVAEGRALSAGDVTDLATGETFIASDALENGLIDSVDPSFLDTVSAGAATTVDRQRNPEAPATGAKVPSNPSGGSGKGVEGEWSAPSLSDFTDQQWSELSASEKTRISHYYADAADTWTDNFDADLNLPHHFPPGHENAGKASLNGVRNALARLNQVKNLHSSAESVRAHLRSHLPDGESEGSVHTTTPTNTQGSYTNGPPTHHRVAGEKPQPNATTETAMPAGEPENPAPAEPSGAAPSGNGSPDLLAELKAMRSDFQEELKALRSENETLRAELDQTKSKVEQKEKNAHADLCAKAAEALNALKGDDEASVTAESLEGTPDSALQNIIDAHKASQERVFDLPDLTAVPMDEGELNEIQQAKQGQQAYLDELANLGKIGGRSATSGGGA